MLNTARVADSVASIGVYYASQTGNGEDIAHRLAESMNSVGFAADLRSFLQLRPAQLKGMTHAVFVISTHGDGDPPDDALDLFEFLRSARAPRLDSLDFRVLALGDSSYVKFCEAGRQLEKLLRTCGATAFAERIECDLDYQDSADRFAGEVIAYCEGRFEPDSPAPRIEAMAEAPQLSVVPSEPLWNRDRPFPATVESVDRMTIGGSGKDVRHVVLSLAGSGLAWEPGDALGVRPFNDPERVDELLTSLSLDPGQVIEREGCSRTVRDWLTRHLEITRLAPDTVRAWGRLAHGPGLSVLLDRFDGKQLKAFIESRQLADLADEFPAKPDAASLIGLLRPIGSRSYSIASSRAFASDDIALTVATFYSNATGRRRSGVASEYLNRRLQTGDEVGVFLESNRRFHLPEDRRTPLILIAAGTGIAPFRAFFQQLEAEAVSPRSWLIFGNPSMRTDFLYQSEWLRWRSDGLLNRIDTAFSRDQAEKRYVQHVVREQAAEIANWLDWGAHIYICGGLAMGRAVDSALIEGIAGHRRRGEKEAAEYLAGMRRDGRLKKDLY